MIGKSAPFSSGTSGGSDDSPPTPADDVSTEFYTWDQTIALKNIASTEVAYAVPRRDWANSTTYDMYEHNISSSNTTTSGASNVYDATFYFRTSDNRVYKVMDNNAGTAYSGSEPTSTSTSAFELGGYTLKYMYTISASDSNKFLTADFMSVATDSTVSGLLQMEQLKVWLLLLVLVTQMEHIMQQYTEMELVLELHLVRL